MSDEREEAPIVPLFKQRGCRLCNYKAHRGYDRCKNCLLYAGVTFDDPKVFIPEVIR